MLIKGQKSKKITGKIFFSRDINYLILKANCLCSELLCKDWNVQLTLAGHTHGGQVIVPWVGERGFSLAGLFLTYTHGLYESEKDPDVRMYVSRGIGTIIAPVRLFCKPEIVEITLTRG